MTNLEFSNEFDILYNNITSNQAPPLDEYEKSVLLTAAQEDICKAYFNPKSSPLQEGFDDSQLRQVDFSELINIESCKEVQGLGINKSSKFYELPKQEIFMVISEILNVNTNQQRIIVPIHYKEYERLMKKPYKFPLKSQAWRMFVNSKDGKLSEIITNINDKVDSYIIKYVKKPTPIILLDLEDGLTIQGESKSTECKLSKTIHRDILNRAVILAKISYESGFNPSSNNNQEGGQ